MKCEFCGKELAEGEVCECTRPYGAAPVPKKKDESILGSLLALYKNWWKNPVDAKETAREDRAYAACGILTAVLFLMTLWYELFFVFCIDLGIKEAANGFLELDFHFGRSLVLSLVMFLLTAAIYFVGKLAATLMTGRRPSGKFFLGCFTDFAVDMIPVPAMLFLGALTSLIAPEMGILFGASVLLYEMILLASEFHNVRIFVSEKAWQLLVLYGIVLVGAFVIGFSALKLTVWATGIEDATLSFFNF